MGSQRKRMLEKNLRCGKRKIFHNDGFYCCKSWLISVKSCLNVESTIYVSHSIHLTHFWYKKCINFNPVINRDTKTQLTHCLYVREKQVFLRIKLAFKPSGKMTSKREVIRKTQCNIPRKNSRNCKDLIKYLFKYISRNEPNKNCRNCRNCKNSKKCNYRISGNPPLSFNLITSESSVTSYSHIIHINPHEKQPTGLLNPSLDLSLYSHPYPSPDMSYIKYRNDDKRYNTYFYFHFMSHTTMVHRTADELTEATIQLPLEERCEENIDEPREDREDLTVLREQHKQREQREQRAFEEYYEIYEEKEEIINVAMITNLFSFSNVNVSVASVAKANTLSISHKTLFLSIFLPPLLYVVSKSVFHNQKAKVEVLTGLLRHSIIALRGIKINVFNVKTLFYSKSLHILTLPLNKPSSKYSNFICLNKTVIPH